MEVRDRSPLQFDHFDVSEPRLNIGALLARVPLNISTKPNCETVPERWGVPSEENMPDVVVPVGVQRLSSERSGAVDGSEAWRGERDEDHGVPDEQGALVVTDNARVDQAPCVAGVELGARRTDARPPVLATGEHFGLLAPAPGFEADGRGAEP
jgi:hypothetical protein